MFFEADGDGRCVRHVHFEAGKERAGDLFFEVAGAAVPELAAAIEAALGVVVEARAVSGVGNGRSVADAVVHAAAAKRHHALARVLPWVGEGRSGLVAGEAADVLRL